MPLKNNKSLGQHWLKDRQILDAIADLARPSRGNPVQGQTTPIVAHCAGYDRAIAPNAPWDASTPCDDRPLGRGRPKAYRREDGGDTMEWSDLELVCLEIGPGLGTLTSSLLRVFDKVIAIEYDPRLAANLPKSFPGKNLEVINEDFLKFDLSQVPSPYVVAGNIPYYITSPIITKLLDAQNPPEKIVLLVQKEVADRILEGPGRHTYLSLSVQSKAEVEPGFLVPKDYFTPPPKVDSAVIILVPRKAPLFSLKALNLAKQGFKNPRKKLIKNLPYDKSVLEPIFKELNIPETARPSDLDHETWQNLTNYLDKIKH